MINYVIYFKEGHTLIFPEDVVTIDYNNRIVIVKYTRQIFKQSVPMKDIYPFENISFIKLEGH